MKIPLDNASDSDRVKTNTWGIGGEFIWFNQCAVTRVLHTVWLKNIYTYFSRLREGGPSFTSLLNVLIALAQASSKSAKGSIALENLKVTIGHSLFPCYLRDHVRFDLRHKSQLLRRGNNTDRRLLFSSKCKWEWEGQSNIFEIVYR